MSDNSIYIRRILPGDNLSSIAASIVGSEWGKDNEMEDYDEQALREFVNVTDNLLLIAYVDEKPAGIVLAAKQMNPYKGDKNWLFIDELDVHPDYRRQGIGRALMKRTFEIAGEWGLKEAWIGTELDNDAANSLYRSLRPSETEKFYGYTYKIDSGNKHVKT